jgi:hypothetical protein
MWQDEPAKTAQMLDILSEQLKRVVNVVPEKALAELREVPIWINPTHKGFRPSAEYHAGAGWLKNNGRDPAMAKCVEISNVAIFPFENVRMPYLMLHELSHAYHDRFLSFDDADIIAAFKKAKASGGYDQVERFTDKKTVIDKAYAMSNHKEYFAELTEAFFGKNNFFPFTKDELKKHDPEMLEILARKWGSHRS